jgi:high-affinity Fe2+/Pb2+ permease
LTVLAAVAVGAVLLQLIVDAMGGGRSIAFGFVLAVLAAGLLGAAAWLQRPRPEARLTVRQMLEEDRLP